MTKIKTSLLLGGILLFGFSCKNKDDGGQGGSSPSTGSVTFSIEKKGGSSSRLSEISDEEVKSVQVTIKDTDGNEQQQNLDLLLFSGSYISEPLELSPGKYTLEGFHVLDADKEVVYSTPIKGSEKAYLVVEPLPKPFEITTNITTQVVPEVISVEGLEPTDLGYATFDFEIVNTLEFWVAGFAYDTDSSDLELTAFKYSVTPAGATAHIGSADAITNMILVRGDEDTYEVSFEKDGYVIVSDVKTTYTLAELAEYTRDHPLKLIFDNNTLADGLVAYYPFNGDANDESDNENHGTVSGATSSTDRFGNDNSAYSYDGENDYITIPHSELLNYGNTDDFSISLWVNIANTQKDTDGPVNDILGKWNSNTSSGYPYAIRYRNANNIAKRANVMNAVRYNTATCQVDTAHVFGEVISTDEWHHIVFQKKGDYISYYEDGVLITSNYDYTIDDGCSTKNNHPIVLGKRNVGESRYFTGKIDDLSFYNRPLTISEITFLAKN